MLAWRFNRQLLAISYLNYLQLHLSEAKSTPRAVSVPVRSAWLGYDGNWSPVSIEVGSPPQWVDLLVSTTSQETWVVGEGGCDGSPECLDKRGGVFAINTSSTWVNQGSYILGLDPRLGFNGTGIYGLDKISLNDQISISSQIVGVVQSIDYWNGFLGLGVKPTNFTNPDIPTFLASMVENKSYIPSHSYGYTAGAYYRRYNIWAFPFFWLTMKTVELKGAPASLTLGGYDLNRFIPHNLTFDLSYDQKPVVAVNSISVAANKANGSTSDETWSGGQQILLDPSQADRFTIDSSTPFLWFPESVCQRFEDALGLTYDQDMQLYSFGTNSSHHDTLVGWNLTFEFELTNLPGSTKAVKLRLPYDAFDLSLSYPNPILQNATVDSPAVNYFPLRKAKNETQYTIGRAFLQEAYLIVDYERNNFSIHQAAFNFDPAGDTDLVDISRPANSSMGGGPAAKAQSGLSKAAISGIAVGVFASLVMFGVTFWFCLKRRSPRRRGYIKEKEAKSPRWVSRESKFFRWLFGLPEPELPAEIGGSQRFAFEAAEGRPYKELPTNLEGGTDASGSEPTAVDMISQGRAINAIGHDPNKPVELPYRLSHCNSHLGLSGPAEPPIIPLNSNRHPFRSTQTAHPPGWESWHPPIATTDISSPSSSDRSRIVKGSSPTFVVSPVTPSMEQSAMNASLLSTARRAAWYVTSDEQHVGTNGTQESQESGVSGLTAESGISPEDSISQGEISRRSTVSPIDDSPPRHSVPTIQEQVEPEDEEDVRRHGKDLAPIDSSTEFRHDSPPISPATTSSARSSFIVPEEPEQAVTRQIRNSLHQGYKKSRFHRSQSQQQSRPQSESQPPLKSRYTEASPNVSKPGMISSKSSSSSKTPRITTTTTTNTHHHARNMNSNDNNTNTNTNTNSNTPIRPRPTTTTNPRPRISTNFLTPASNAASIDQNLRTPVSAVTGQSTYSPARWIEFWRTGRDPREPRRNHQS